MKKTKQKLSATWEILSTAEYVEELDREVNDDDLIKIYQGSFVPLLLSNRVDRKQIWHVVIKTTAKADDGTIHEHEMEWSFNKMMSIKEVISGAKHIKVERDGLKVRWSGVSDQWIKAVDEDLKDLTAVSAWATATCVGMVEQVNPVDKLISNVQGWKFYEFN